MLRFYLFVFFIFICRCIRWHFFSILSYFSMKILRNKYSHFSSRCIRFDELNKRDLQRTNQHLLQHLLHYQRHIYQVMHHHWPESKTKISLLFIRIQWWKSNSRFSWLHSNLIYLLNKTYFIFICVEWTWTVMKKNNKFNNIVSGRWDQNQKCWNVRTQKDYDNWKVI